MSCVLPWNQPCTVVDCQDLGQLSVDPAAQSILSYLSPSSFRFRGAEAPHRHTHDFPAASHVSPAPVASCVGLILFPAVSRDSEKKRGAPWMESLLRGRAIWGLRVSGPLAKLRGRVASQ